jgi:hypothetical protein
MLSAFAEAARAMGRGAPASSPYYQAARRNADFLLTQLRPDGRLRRTWRAGQSSPEVFLEDYAALILGLLDLYETDFDNRWFSAAQELADEMIARFNDPDGGFFDTPSDGEPLLIRPKDVQDNATPCGNSLAVEALLRLSALTERAEIRTKAEDSFRLVAESAFATRRLLRAGLGPQISPSQRSNRWQSWALPPRPRHKPFWRKSARVGDQTWWPRHPPCPCPKTRRRSCITAPCVMASQPLMCAKVSCAKAR